MQMKLMMSKFDEEHIISLQTNASISSWIVDYYFTEFNEDNSKNIIGIYDMWMIFQMIRPLLSIEDFWNICQRKLKSMENDSIVEEYDVYLNRCGLLDLIDLMHCCQSELMKKTILLSTMNIQNELDRLFFQYLLELSSTDCVQSNSIATEITDNKNDLKHTLCMYLSSLLDTRNDYALIHCLLNSPCFDIKREIITELQSISQTDRLHVYEILQSFLQRSSLQCDSTGDIVDQLFDMLNREYHNIKEFFDFFQQLRMIIEENQHGQIESNIIFRKLLQSICQQFQTNVTSDTYEPMIEQFCQCFQNITLQMNRTSSSSIQSASSQATPVDCHFVRSIRYLCVKQTIDLNVFDEQHDLVKNSFQTTEDKKREFGSTVYRSLDLSVIHETSFECDSLEDKQIDHPSTDSQSKILVKRQPLRVIDVNSFNNEERQAQNEKNHSHNLTIRSLVSDDDKENHPAITKKRSIFSNKIDPPSKKQKKTNLSECELNSFQSTN